MKQFIILFWLFAILTACRNEENLNFTDECDLIKTFFEHLNSHEGDNYDQIFKDFFTENELRAGPEYLKVYSDQFDYFKTLETKNFECRNLDSTETVFEYGKGSRFHKFKLKRVGGYLKIESCITLTKGQDEVGFI